MAIGNRNNSFNGKAYTAKLKLKDGEHFLDVPHFEFQTKVGGEYVTLTDAQIKEAFGVEAPVRDVSGNLVAIDTRIGEFEGEPIHNVTVSLRDPDRNEVYYVQFVSNNNLGRSIANSLLNLQSLDNVQFGLWGQVNKEKRKTYPACSIRQGDSNDTIKWKYDPKTDERFQPRIFKGKRDKDEKDWTAVDEFIFSELAGAGAQLAASRQSNKAQNTPQQESHAEPRYAAPAPRQAAATPPAPSENLDEDVPF